MREIGLGLLGVGTVGSGVLEIYRQHRADLEGRAGCRLTLVAASARDLGRPRPGLGGADWPLTTEPERVVADARVSLVIELIGGLEPARTLVLRALQAGKHVVTANKALLAHHGAELFVAARRKGVFLGFEAAVAGGVPIIRALRDGLAANRILALRGIVNGTCNYILTKMTDEGRDFADVLREAQAAGYAEADPTLDVEGWTPPTSSRSWPPWPSGPAWTWPTSTPRESPRSRPPTSRRPGSWATGSSSWPSPRPPRARWRPGSTRP